MYNQRTEYHREVRDVDEPKQSGWKSWFGLGDNKEDERDRGYNYQSTTTLRNPQSSSGYERERYNNDRITSSGPYSSGYAGSRGGYGYTSSDEVTRPSFNSDRDYTTRQSYGQPTGDRDVYYKQETRTYGGADRDREYTPSSRTMMSGADYHPTTSRNYGFSGETMTGRDYPTTRDYGYSSSNNTTSRDYHPSSTMGRTSDNYSTMGRNSDNYSTTYGGGPSSRGYGFERDTYTSRNTHPESSRTYGMDSSRRETTTGGYGGDSWSSTRPSYQQSTYRY